MSFINKKLITLLLSLPLLQPAAAQSVPAELYKAAAIPEALKENANSIVRFSDISMTVKNKTKINIKQHEIITVLNEKAEREAVLFLPYNKKYDNYSSIEMRVYDADGKLLKKYHKSDMYDGSAVGEEELVTDERFLGLKHTIASYPETIEKSYEEDLNSSIDLGSWDIQAKEQAVQNASYSVAIDKDAGFRYLNKNTNIKPVKVTANNNEVYTWKLSNLKAVKIEEGAVSWRILPRILFASNYFQYYGNDGSLRNWTDFGKWLLALNSDGRSLLPQREQEIKQMTDSIKTDKGKARFLYNYLQKNMRYVSVQLGIGGLKPFAATFVDQKKYGDCKALSNYMSALLKAVNIPSYYAVVNAGPNEEPADNDFAYNGFNHVILCVPFKGDTTWLECTSNTQPFGKLGTFTENRTALLVTPDGGKLVNTPKSTMQDNQFKSEVHLVLDADGGAKADLKIEGTGGYRDEYVGWESMKLDEQKDEFTQSLHLKQPIGFNFKPSTDKDGVKTVNINLEYDKFCDIAAGDKKFYRPHAIDLCAFTLPIEENRKSDYYFEHPMQKSSVTVIDLPAGYEIESLPAAQTLKFDYGSYDVNYVYDSAKNQVKSVANFKLTTQVIPAAKYNDLQQYLDAVARAQNKKMVIRKKT